MFIHIYIYMYTDTHTYTVYITYSLKIFLTPARSEAPHSAAQCCS